MPQRRTTAPQVSVDAVGLVVSTRALAAADMQHRSVEQQQPAPRTSHKNEHLLLTEPHKPDRPSDTSSFARRPAPLSPSYAGILPLVPRRGTIKEVTSAELLPTIPYPLRETSAAALEWPRLREYISSRTYSPLGRAWILALEPSADLAWIDLQQQRTAEMRRMLNSGGRFDFHGLFDPTQLL